MTQKNKTHLKFLHCSDIHLDSPIIGLSAEKSEERRRVLRNSFMRLMQYVRESNIDVVLMSGDLFDIKYATNTTAEVLIREFKNCPDTDFIISPGKHDYYTDNPIYTSGRLPKNCYVFNSDSRAVINVAVNYRICFHTFFHKRPAVNSYIVILKIKA